ncbi:mobilization protein, partial [Odoribacter splanchnicus]|nr:mobilization protein [Odoribacter splanchnicus]
KHQIGNTVKAACYGYRFQSFGEYKALLATYNICAEEVKGEVNGKPYQGIVYSATNDKGEKAGNPVKASRIGKSVGYEAVQRRMEKSGEAIKNGKLKERTRKIVADAVRNTRSRKELEQQLKKQGIDVVFRQNDSGRIYGVTFIDHDSRVVLNGSRLGKEYSANVFNERFSGETGNIHQSEVETQQREQSTHQEQPGFTPKADIVSGVASVLGAFGGLLGGGVSGGDEPQDTANQKRKKKKKKRTRRIE